MRYIDADRLKAEIERYKQGVAIARFDNAGENADYFQGKVDLCDDLTHIIAALQQEQPPRGYDEAYLNKCIAKATKTWEGVDADKYLDEVRGREHEQPEVSARHGWVARNMNNDLHYFSVKPVRSGAKWWDRDYLSMEIDGALFGELTWEDEPIEVELFIRELGFNPRKEDQI